MFVSDYIHDQCSVIMCHFVAIIVRFKLYIKVVIKVGGQSRLQLCVHISNNEFTVH